MLELLAERIALKGEAFSYLMLFCTLLQMKNGKASRQQWLAVVPLRGQARRLADQLSHRVGGVLPGSLTGGNP